MRTKIRNIAIFMLLSAITMTPYYILRSASVEKKYIDGVIIKAAMIRPVAEMLNREESPDQEKVKKVFNDIMNREPSTAALILTDKTDSMKFLVKNDSIIRTGTVVDLLLEDIRERSFAAEGRKEPYVRNYSNGRGGDERFYIYPFISGGQKTYAVYGFHFERKTVVRLAMEILLLLCFSFMLTGVVLSFLRKKGLAEDPDVKTIILGAGKTTSDGTYEVKGTKASRGSKAETAKQIDENELSPVIGTGTDRNINEMIRSSKPEKEGANDALNARIFELFKQLHKELKPDSIALYIKKMEGRLSKTYELKEKTFLRIDSSLFDNIKVSEIENSKRSGAHILDDGKIIRIPLIDDESLLGLIEIRLKDSSGTLDLGKIQGGVKDVSRDIKEFLVINNVIVDRETGFYSSSYFNMKLSEQIYSAQKIGTGFYLLLIDIFRDVDIDKDQKNTVLKIIYPVIKRSSGDAHELFLRNGKIGMILPGIGMKEAESIELAVSKDISKFRIKLSADNTIRLKPVGAIMNSAEAADIKDILNETLALFDVEN